MAIIEYRDHEIRPTFSAHLADLSEYSIQTKGLLMMLGDFWTQYYRDTDVIALASSGFVTAASREFNQLLDLVLSGNITDIPVAHGYQFELLSFKQKDFETIYAEDGSIDSYFIPIDDIIDFEYLCSELFEPKVTLVKDTHYSIADNGVYFYVDLFNDPSIATYIYDANENAEKSVLFWGSPVILSSTYIYERFGRFLYQKSYDHNRYKWFVASLMRYYTHAKTALNIEDVLDALYGIPYARYDNETILDYTYVDDNLDDWEDMDYVDEAPYIRITTDKNIYYTFAFSQMTHEVGDTVKQFDLFSSFTDVIDYINRPGWWEDEKIIFPEKLFSSEASAALTQEQKNELFDKVLKYNTVYIRLNVSYETYQTYLIVVDQLYEIIKSGFPVYLFPFVQSVFEAAFVDDFYLYEQITEKFRLVIDYCTEDKWPYWWKMYNGDLTYGISDCDKDACDGEFTKNYVFCYNGKIKNKGAKRHGTDTEYDAAACGRNCLCASHGNKFNEPDPLWLDLSFKFFEPRVRCKIRHDGEIKTNGIYTYGGEFEMFAHERWNDVLLDLSNEETVTVSDMLGETSVITISFSDLNEYLMEFCSDLYSVCGQNAKDIFEASFILNLSDKSYRRRDLLGGFTANLKLFDKEELEESLSAVIDIPSFSEKVDLNWPHYNGAIYYGKNVDYGNKITTEYLGNICFKYDTQNDILVVNPYYPTFISDTTVDTFFSPEDRVYCDVDAGIEEERHYLNFAIYDEIIAHGGMDEALAPHPDYVSLKNGKITYPYKTLSESFDVKIHRS